MTKVLLAGAAGAYMLHRARKSPAPRAYARARGTVPPPDPRDPVQGLYSETDDVIELDRPAEGARSAKFRDSGDLYGVHMAPAADPTHVDDDVAMEDGQNWLEALQTDSIEAGPVPEYEVSIVEDEELRRAGHASDKKDTPIADFGSGGRAGA